MARTTVKLPQDLLVELMSLVQTQSKTEAVIIAVKNKIRRQKLDSIKALAGKLEFTAEADTLRHGDHSD